MSNFENRLLIASQLANQHSDLILRSLGFSIGRSGAIKCPCPIHGGDNLSGFSWHPKKKIWSCWTNLCHKEYGAGLIGLIMGIKKIPIELAIDYVFNITQSDINNIDLSQIESEAFILKHKNNTSIDKKFIFPFDQINNLEHNVSYFINRNYKLETLDTFLAFECNKKNHKLFGRACIPLIDENNDIIGFTGRIMNDEIISKFNPKWMHYPYQVPKDKILYGFINNKDEIIKNKTIILTEGPLDVWSLYENNIRIAVALLGTYISQYQIELLLQSKVTTIIPLFDPDKGGNIALEYLKDKCSVYFNINDTVQKLLTKDPGEMNSEEIKLIITEPIEKIIENNYNRYCLCKQK